MDKLRHIEGRLLQLRAIAKENWDYLIILDACRYDCFKDLYGEYLNGKLKKAISPVPYTIGSKIALTTQWLRKVFSREYNGTVYISSSPRVNSKLGVQGFSGKDHFFKVVDAWDWGWDDRIGTTHPEVVTDAALKAKKQYPDKRLIVHYKQPHHPYISSRKLQHRERDAEFKKIPRLLSNLLQMLLHKTEKFMNMNIREGLIYRLSKSIGLPSFDYFDFTLRKGGKRLLREAYRENVKIVLKYLSEFVNEVSGNIIVTSDHGELLGEGGRYGHRCGKRLPALVEVPWLEVVK